MKGKGKPKHEARKRPGEFHKTPLRQVKKKIDKMGEPPRPKQVRTEDNLQ